MVIIGQISEHVFDALFGVDGAVEPSVEVGDTVAYTTKWLVGTGQQIGPCVEARGLVVAERAPWVRVQWDGEDEPSLVAPENLKRLGDPEPADVDKHTPYDPAFDLGIHSFYNAWMTVCWPTPGFRLGQKVKKSVFAAAEIERQKEVK
jgi:hypothetical protein